MQGLNRYSYVNNNPVRYTDPTGHMMSEDRDGGKGKHCDANCYQYIQQKKDEHKKKNDTLKRIRQEIDRRFDPFKGWLPSNVAYEEYMDGTLPTLDYEAEQAYIQAGYDVMQIASQNQDNPMTEDDWVHSNVDYDYIYSKGVGTRRAPGHLFFLDYMNRDINNPSNYEANYLNALMVTHEKELDRAKKQYYKELLDRNGSLQAAWEFLQMTIDVAGPAG